MGMFARAASKAFDQGIGTIAAGAHILQMGSGRSATGISITTDRAMKYSAFWGAVRILSEDVAKLPLGVYEQRADGSVKPRPDHPLESVIHYAPNPQMTSFTWREVGMAHDLTWGNAYSLIGRDQGGKGFVKELWPISTERMEVDRNGDTGEKEYRYTRSTGERVDLTSTQVLHVPGLSWDGVKGYSVVRQARESIGLGLAAEEHGARFFGQSATTNMMFGTDKPLSDTALRHIEESIEVERTSLENAWRPWVLEEGLKPLISQLPNDDAQWLETRVHQVNEIARWFRIPPHKLAELGKATFSNIEQQSMEYVTDTLMGWLVRWETAIGQQLLGDEWIGAGGKLYVKFNVSALLRGDLKSRFESYAIGRQWGFINGDKIAELEEWNKWEGGDVYLVPMNMTTVNPDGSITHSTIAPLGAPAVPAPAPVAGEEAPPPEGNAPPPPPAGVQA